MINNLSEEELFAQGHNACAGCAQALAVRIVLKAAGKNTIVSNATGCLEVFSTPYPLTAWKIPWVHVAFETAAAVASGIDRALMKLGKRDKINLLAFAGDGGTFDIGLQALSGAAERGQKFTYVCFDNGAYMNTGIQRSGATPKYADTTTSPVGKKIHGKTENRKNLPMIMAAHGCYVATASAAFPQDLANKVKKALSFNGPSYIQVDVACPLGWRHASNLSIKVMKIGVQTRAIPLFEIENGKVKITMKIDAPKPVEDWLSLQGRFKQLTPELIKEIQEHVNDEYGKLLNLEKTGVRLY